MMRLSPDAIDNHCHVLDPRRPSVPGAQYEPFDASLRDYEDHLQDLGIRRGVLVTASTHGTDNEPMVEALRRSDRDLCGVAVVTPGVTDEELGTLHAVGVRGVRVQDQFAGGTPLDALVSLGDRLAGLHEDDGGWHFEVWTDVSNHLDWLPAAIRRCRVPVVIDHLGFFPDAARLAGRAVDTMIDLARSTDTWITLSGAYRLARDEPPDRAGERLAPRVRQLLEAVPDRLLWGSDWPHVVPPNATPTSQELLAELDLWFDGDQPLLDQVTVTNNATCYRFGVPTPIHEPGKR